MVLALLLAIMTAMAGSSRTLYQGSVDGWLPRYLSYVNSHGAPTRAMWTDLVFNLLLLTIASDAAGYFSVLAVSNVGYIIFNFLNLNAGWIHRIDSGHIERPYRAPTFLLRTGYEQVRSIVAALAGDTAAARRVELVLPETGVCSVPKPLRALAPLLPAVQAIAAIGNCCGGPAKSESACCVADEQAKSDGKEGCGCS